MPARKPIGAVVRNATTVITVQSPGRLVVGEPAEEDDDAGADRPEERRHPGRPQEARAGQALQAVARRSRSMWLRLVRCVSYVGHLLPFWPSTRYCTSASSCSSESDCAVGVRHHVTLIARREDGVRILDRLAQELVERLRRPDRPRPGSGPTCASVPAGSKAWQPPQPAVAKTASPEVSSAAPPAASSARYFSYCGLLDDPDRRPHRRVAEPAELRADDRVLADPRRRDHERRLDSGHGVGLLPELRHPERVDHVERVQRQLHRPVDRQHELPGHDLVVRRDTRTSRRTAARSRRCEAGSGPRRRSGRARSR